MSHTPHELAEEFPRDINVIHKLRALDPHFRRLADDYHNVNRAIHRAETDVEPCSDDYQASLRRTRLHLKDQIAGILAGA